MNNRSFLKPIAALLAAVIILTSLSCGLVSVFAELGNSKRLPDTALYEIDGAELIMPNWETVSHTSVTPLGFTSATGTEMVTVSGSEYSVNDGAMNTSMAFGAFNLNNIGFSDYEGFVVYLKLEAENSFMPLIELTMPADTSRWNEAWKPLMMIAAYSDLEYIELGGTEWKTKTTVAGVTGSQCFGTLQFDSAFEGFVKIPFSALVNDSGFSFNTELDTVAAVYYRFKGLSGDFGKVTAGPTLFYKYSEDPVSSEETSSDDSADTLSIPSGASLITEKVNLFGSLNTWCIPKTDTVGGKTVETFTLYGYGESTGTLPYNADNVTRLTFDKNLTGSDYIAFRLEISAANKLGVCGFKTSDGSEIIFQKDEKYEILPDGATNWTEKTSVSGRADGIKTYGALEFASAFSGWVRLPLSAFYNAPEKTDSVYEVRFMFSELRAEYGGVVIGPFVSMQKPQIPDTSSEESSSEEVSSEVSSEESSSDVSSEETSSENSSEESSSEETSSEVSSEEASSEEVSSDTSSEEASSEETSSEDTSSNESAPSLALPEGATLITEKVNLFGSLNTWSLPKYVTIGESSIETLILYGYGESTETLPYNADNVTRLTFDNNLAGSDYIAFRLEIPAANKVGISGFKTSDGSEIIFRKGEKYGILPDGATVWSEKTSVSGREDNLKTYGALEFDSAFSGWVRLPLSAFYNAPAKTDSVYEVRFMFSELREEYGGVVIGPFVSMQKPQIPDTSSEESSSEQTSSDVSSDDNTSSDSSDSSEIEKLEKLPSGATLLTEKVELKNSLNTWSLPNKVKIGDKTIETITVIGYGELKGATPYNSDNVTCLSFDKALTGSGYVAFRIELPAANSFGICGFKADGSEIIFQKEEKYEILADGETEWKEFTSVKGRDDNLKTYGALEFDSAFKGWVRISLKAFYNAPTLSDSINEIRLMFSEFTAEYGRVNIGPFISMENEDIPSGEGSDTPSGELKLPSGATLLTEKLELKNSLNTWTLPKTVKIGDKTVETITVIGYAEKTGALPYNSDNVTSLIFDKALTGSNYVAFRIEMPSANSFGLSGFKADGSEIIVMKGQKYELLSDGETEWKEYKTTKGREDDLKTYGALNIDFAFKGWVRIPLRAFYNTPSVDDSINEIRFMFSEFTAETGRINIGPFIAMTEAPYVAENVWDKSKLPEMTPFPNITGLDKYWEVGTETLPSPIPSLSDHQSIRISVDPAIDKEGKDYMESWFWIANKYDGVNVDEFTHLMFYVEVPSTKENRLSLCIFDDSGFEYKVMAKQLYSLLKLGSDEWEHGYCEDVGLHNYGGIILPAGFKGFVKIPLASLMPSNIPDGTKFAKFSYRFAYIGSEEESVLVGGVFGVTRDNDPGPGEVTYSSLPEPTTIKKIYVIDNTDIFADKVMLYWEEYDDAKSYLIEAYTMTKVDKGFEYKLVKSKTAFTNSGTIGGLDYGTQYAILVKACDANGNVIATYEFIRAKTLRENPYKFPSYSDEVLYDGVEYASAEETPAVNVTMIIIVAGAVLVLGGAAVAVTVIIRKRRKTNV